MSWFTREEVQAYPVVDHVAEELECLVRPGPVSGWEWVCQVVATTFYRSRFVGDGIAFDVPTTTRTVLESGTARTEGAARLAARRAAARDGRGKWSRA